MTIASATVPFNSANNSDDWRRPTDEQVLDIIKRHDLAAYRQLSPSRGNSPLLGFVGIAYAAMYHVIQTHDYDLMREMSDTHDTFHLSGVLSERRALA